MMLTGTRVRPLVTNTRNMIIGFDARDLSGLVSCISRNACSPKGVAALSIPSIVALMFISIEPKAGCPLGRSGKIRVKNGLTTRDN